MDVSPNQLVSVAASLIPFLEHDDANRALMGSNMQRQAVPAASRRAAPHGGHGHGGQGGPGLRACVSWPSGTASSIQVDATRIVVKADRDEAKRDWRVDRISTTWLKFQRSNQNTCIQPEAHRARGRPGDRRATFIADGPPDRPRRTCPRQERRRRVHALGRLQLRGFDSHLGAHGADDDHYTSIHIEEFECIARDTKLGKEEITRDIPNVGEEALKNLDESGIVRIGAEVKVRATFWSARSRPRARPSCPRRRSCCVPSSAKRPATCATARSGSRRASSGVS